MQNVTVDIVLFDKDSVKGRNKKFPSDEEAEVWIKKHLSKKTALVFVHTAEDFYIVASNENGWADLTDKLLTLPFFQKIIQEAAMCFN